MNKNPHASLMRRHVLHLIAALTILPTSMLAQTPETSMPQTIVRSLIDAMAANNAETIRAAFGDTAAQAYGNGAPKSGDAFRAWLQSDIIEPHGRVENAVLSGDGPEVVVTGQYRNNNGYSNAANFLMVVKDGKIISWTMRY